MTKTQYNRKLWKEKTKQYDAKFFGTAPTRLPPTGVDHLFSVVFVRGTRHFAFKSEEQRDAFVSVFNGAEPCVDPAGMW